MDTTDAPAYGTPEAKARIKQLKAAEAALNTQLRASNEAERAYERAQTAADPEYRSWNDTSAERKALRAAGDDLREQWRQVRDERLALQTAPLPCKVSELPGSVVDPAQLVQAPQDMAAYSAGDTVAVHSRGSYRLAVVVEVRRTNLEVAYTTQGARAEAMRWGRGPEHVTVTRKVVKLDDLYNHEPKAPTQQPVPVLAAVPAPADEPVQAEAPVAADEQQALRDTMAAHKDGWRMYHTARTQLAELVAAGASVGCTEARRDVMAAWHDDYTAYRRAYRQLLALQKACGVPVHEEVVAA